MKPLYTITLASLFLSTPSFAGTPKKSFFLKAKITISGEMIEHRDLGKEWRKEEGSGYTIGIEEKISAPWRKNFEICSVELSRNQVLEVNCSFGDADGGARASSTVSRDDMTKLTFAGGDYAGGAWQAEGELEVKPAK